MPAVEYRLHFFLEKTPHISFACKLVSVLHREYDKYGLLSSN